MAGVAPYHALRNGGAGRCWRLASVYSRRAMQMMCDAMELQRLPATRGAAMGCKIKGLHSTHGNVRSQRARPVIK